MEKIFISCCNLQYYSTYIGQGVGVGGAEPGQGTDVDLLDLDLLAEGQSNILLYICPLIHQFLSFAFVGWVGHLEGDLERHLGTAVLATLLVEIMATVAGLLPHGDATEIAIVIEIASERETEEGSGSERGGKEREKGSGERDVRDGDLCLEVLAGHLTSQGLSA